MSDYSIRFTAGGEVSGKTARVVKNLTGEADWIGDDVRVYHVDPPVVFTRDEDAPVEFTDHLIVSAVTPEDGRPDQTYIFPAELDENGEWDVADWYELPGSIPFFKDHVRALNLAGYQVVE